MNSAHAITAVCLCLTIAFLSQQANLAPSSLRSFRVASQRRLNATAILPSRYVVISSAADPLYSFFVPITSLIWKRVHGFEPVIVLVNDVAVGNNTNSTWEDGIKHTAIIMTYLQKWGLAQNVVRMDYNTSIAAKNNVLMSQMSRLYVSGMCGLSGPLRGLEHPETWVVTTDVDIFPVANQAYYLPDNASNWLGKITNAYCCTAGYQVLNFTVAREYPMTTLAFQVRTWQDLMNHSCICSGKQCGKQVMAHINQEMVRVFGLGSPAGDALGQWGFDQRYFSYRIHLREDIHNKTQLAGRSVGSDRIDRAWWSNQNWSESLLKRYVDSHVLRPGYTDSHWPLLKRLLKPILKINTTIHADAKVWQELDDYRLELFAAVS